MTPPCSAPGVLYWQVLCIFLYISESSLIIIEYVYRGGHWNDGLKKQHPRHYQHTRFRYVTDLFQKAMLNSVNISQKCNIDLKLISHRVVSLLYILLLQSFFQFIVPFFRVANLGVTIYCCDIFSLPWLIVLTWVWTLTVFSFDIYSNVIVSDADAVTPDVFKGCHIDRNDDGGKPLPPSPKLQGSHATSR